MVAAKGTSAYSYPAELYTKPKRSSLHENGTLSVQSILCSTAKAPVAQLLGASDQNSEDPGLNSGWISVSNSINLGMIYFNLAFQQYLNLDFIYLFF